ncbi:MAG: hypothetical protein QOK21_2028 [Solirubrobacteraceae bacterium]|jgi:hypothetical protein|nr:hypothetical protein [Solirubrobacteraceae bacterium]
MSSVPEPLPLPGDAPDIIAPVHAFRDWRVSDDGLASPRTGVLWTERVMSAECRPRTPEALLAPEHQPPGRACSCGIHAYFRPNSETSRIDFTGVTGIVTVWGHLAVHENGLRAEFARVEALGVYRRWTRRQKAVVADVAASLDIDVVDLAELEHSAHRYATPLPSELIPSPRPRSRSSWNKRPLTVKPRLLLVER